MNTKRIARPRQAPLPRVVEVGDHLQGVVARWFEDRGYGWIEIDGCPDIFCGRRQLLNAHDLQRRDGVEFDLAMDHLGRFMAVNVTLLDGEPISRWQTHSDPSAVAIDSPSFPLAPWEDA